MKIDPVLSRTSMCSYIEIVSVSQNIIHATEVCCLKLCMEMTYILLLSQLSEVKFFLENFYPISICLCSILHYRVCICGITMLFYCIICTINTNWGLLTQICGEIIRYIWKGAE